MRGMKPTVAKGQRVSRDKRQTKAQSQGAGLCALATVEHAQAQRRRDGCGVYRRRRDGGVRGDAASVRAARYNQPRQLTRRLGNVLAFEEQPSMANPSSYASS